MAVNGNLLSYNCIGDKSVRFGKLNQLIPAIFNKVLANELKELVAFSLVERKRIRRSSFKSGIFLD
ncbi:MULTISPECIES: winged helix-turn-helix transcriptional regulator [Flavobacterium]|uniref:Winged helix-turn-helix transcriptional regulator n=1 Tax=Flavobacterium gawalongense TaxID=2594432 RepID=A0ABY3CL59_9FLAO|nr:winged helix-turn-helix transcriptional regulator [Flavobacterium gawalongense]TRX06541.1 winged helix-turn-helix transcriptional regulator [Flavobacterium gawalongense]